ncbi:nucleotidyltransferase domain-containing protein [Aciduricibacillus chroicocephali]|uniref:Nucleotidyltransferase domain-containing protein n=1 Tax=Aciduricibacillus chroicocephali TaxID=3054939 RepID=A0ABY9KYW9_9BACI|nr:nucleotidyltransferase domain-containing protein [Bacillaceae bacterium 44XB]
MEQLIKDKILEVEKRFHVKVLFAIDAGSRAWGFPSQDSDYDVRFIYIHQPDWYLSIDQQGVGTKQNVIELPIDEMLDMSGWEITKALRLFRKSNPSLLEWLRSSIVYYEKYSFIEDLKRLEPMVFKPSTCLYHYMNIAESNYHEHLQGPIVKAKKYFYALRAALACEWIEKYKTAPPVEFKMLLEDILPDGELKDEIEQLQKRKMEGDELDTESRNTIIDEYLESELERIEAYSKRGKAPAGDPTPALNALFRSTLMEVYPSS